MIKILLLNILIGGDEFLTKTNRLKYPERQAIVMSGRHVHQNFAIERKPQILVVCQITWCGIQLLESRFPLPGFAEMVFYVTSALLKPGDDFFQLVGEALHVRSPLVGNRKSVV